MGTIAGSSPRVWGAPALIGVCWPVPRLIPTCVGSTPKPCYDERGTPAHPHVCGEHLSNSHTVSHGKGSSPRVWGAHPRRNLHGHLPRLIPTCVGSTPSPRPGLGRAPAHPHVCGEHPSVTMNSVSPVGSSPRVWGALKRAVPLREQNRLIPTCVGSTPVVSTSWLCTAAHPHVCGEHTDSRVLA